MSELMMICVPGAEATADHVLLRVVLVPRLQGTGTTLADYGMQDWPATITGASFDVTLRTAAGTDLPVGSVPVLTDAAPQVWQAFFGAITVTPFTGQPTYPAPVVTPSTHHAEQITSAYATATQAVGDPAVVTEQVQGLSFQAPPPAPDAGAPVPTPGPPDFHRAIALLREHPTVLRSLGLIVDLFLDPALVNRCGGSGAVRVDWPAVNTRFDTVTSPRTRFEMVGGRFLPAAAGPIRAGQVDLSTSTEGVSDWTVQTVDIDGAVARLGGAQSSLQQTALRVRAAPPDTTTTGPAVLPALRSLGLQVTHRVRGEMFAQRAARAALRASAAATADPPDLTADDLVLGYRLDVREAGGSWYSMMRRQATYTVGGTTIAGPTGEEGHVKAAAAVRGTDHALYADEVVVRWDGARLAVPTVQAGRSPATNAPASANPSTPTYDFSWLFEVDPAEPPGAPELRFSHSYQLRLRVADLAGGGLGVDDVAGEDMAAQLMTYGRHEPVLPPEMPAPPGLLTTSDTGSVVVDEAVLGPGGALDRLVVRSDPAGDTPLGAYPDNTQRVLLPPAATFTLAEWEGALDGTDADTWRLARRALAAPRASAVPVAGRQYTWLPDPAAQGVSMTVVPASSRNTVVGPRLQAWDPAAWPDHEGKTLTVRAGAPGAAPAADWDSPTAAYIVLPPAMRASVDVASFIDSVYFGRFIAANWAPIGTTAQQAVITGRHPTVTPARRIDIVHAVRRPLAAPAATLVPTRTPGSTSARLSDPDAPWLGADRDSTLQLDVSASWIECSDDAAAIEEPAGSGFATQPVTRALGSLPVDLDAPSVAPIEHDFGDTRHRTVTYRIAARSRFRDFFDAGDPETAFINEASLPPVEVPSTARPAPLSIVSALPGFTIDRATPATLTRTGGTVRVELAGPWFTTGAGEQVGLIVSPAAGLPATQWEPGVTGTPADASGPLAHLVTTAYRDPIQPTAGPHQPDSSTLTGTAGDPLVVRDPESGSPVCVVPFDVFRRGDRRFADIGLGDLADTGSAFPLVRLSLVRFQRHSLLGLTCSSIVRTDLITVLPTRTLNVVPAGQTITVTLTGPNASYPGMLGGSTFASVRLEASAPGSATDLTALDATSPGWTTVSRNTVRVNHGSASIPVPADGRDFRVVVQEFTHLAPSDDALSTDPLIAASAYAATFVAVLPIPAADG